MINTAIYNVGVNPDDRFKGMHLHFFGRRLFMTLYEASSRFGISEQKLQDYESYGILHCEGKIENEK